LIKSYINVKVKIFDNYTIGENHLGKAVFAARDYKKGSVILMFEGPIVSKKDLPKDLTNSNDRYVQISPTKYMGPSGTTDDLINHSCDPNAGLNFTDFGILLVAIKPISKGEEITWDYSTTIYRDAWRMECDCRTQKCRKVINSFIHLPHDLKKQYLELGILPPYIVKAFEKELSLNKDGSVVYNNRHATA
jgi:hypothetical protein